MHNSQRIFHLQRNLILQMGVQVVESASNNSLMLYKNQYSGLRYIVQRDQEWDLESYSRILWVKQELGAVWFLSPYWSPPVGTLSLRIFGNIWRLLGCHSWGCWLVSSGRHRMILFSTKNYSAPDIKGAELRNPSWGGRKQPQMPLSSVLWISKEQLASFSFRWCQLLVWGVSIIGKRRL